MQIKPFITSHSGGDDGYYVKVRVSSLDELHEAHRVVMDAFDPGLMERVARKAGVDLGGNKIKESGDER